MKILIVGGSGFVGSYLNNHLQKEHTVNFTCYSSNESEIVYNAEIDLLTDLITEKYDIVINNVNPGDLSTNGVTRNIESVIEYCKKHSAWMIQISSFFASTENRDANDYTQKKAISEEIIQSQLPEGSYTILRFAQLFDLEGLSRKTQGGLYYLAEMVKKKSPINLFANHSECSRNYMPIALLLEIVEKVINEEVKGLHNAYFNSLTLSFQDIIRNLENSHPEPYCSELLIGDRDGMTYSIEKESELISNLVKPNSMTFYLNEFFHSIKID